ncbi:hypothetical protein EBT16_06085 [bacterium]|nr:hypothetical protein [bacterium]
MNGWILKVQGEGTCFGWPWQGDSTIVKNVKHLAGCCVFSQGSSLSKNLTKKARNLNELNVSGKYTPKSSAFV